jgi:hypothetical protein
MNNRILKRMFRKCLNERKNLIQELVPQAGPLLLIPDRCI